MTVRRLVSLALLLSVTTSSVEVLFGGDAALWEQASEGLASGVLPTPSPDSTDGDCPCLCACVCAGAQQVVSGGVLDFTPVARADVGAGASPRVRARTLPSPRPDLRPPMA